MSIKWAQIIPLIGGLPIGMENVFQSKPLHVFSFDGFQNNDQHYINYLRENEWTGNYYTVDECTNDIISNTIKFSDNLIKEDIDVVGCVAPCAGLSSFSNSSNANSPVNDWMYKCSEFILNKVRPKIFWGENSIYLCTDKGRPVADKLARIGKNCDYTFLIYATENRMHGNPQKRARTFYFYFRNDIFNKGIPILNKLPIINKSVEELLLDVKTNKNDKMNIPINEGNPADHPFYQYLYEAFNAKNHRDLVLKISPELDNKVNALTIIGYTILNNKNKLLEISQWMKDHGYEKAADRILAIKGKLDSGKNAWMKGPMIARGFIPAFVGDLVECFIHPFECRYLTYREALSIMSMPETFNMIGNLKSNRNHIAQNVCTSTSEIMSNEILKMLRFENEIILANDQYIVQDHRKNDKLEFRKI